MSGTGTFDTFVHNCRQLSSQINKGGYQIDELVAIARGGWIPARLLSDMLGVKTLHSFGVTYADADRTQLTTYSTPLPIPRQQTLLLIEDCLESGKSLFHARDWFKNANNTVLTCSLFITSETIEAPDYYLETLATLPTFPWELI